MTHKFKLHVLDDGTAQTEQCEHGFGGVITMAPGHECTIILARRNKSLAIVLALRLFSALTLMVFFSCD